MVLNKLSNKLETIEQRNVEKITLKYTEIDFLFPIVYQSVSTMVIRKKKDEFSLYHNEIATLLLIFFFLSRMHSLLASFSHFFI